MALLQTKDAKGDLKTMHRKCKCYIEFDKRGNFFFKIKTS